MSPRDWKNPTTAVEFTISKIVWHSNCFVILSLTSTLFISVSNIPLLSQLWLMLITTKKLLWNFHWRASPLESCLHLIKHLSDSQMKRQNKKSSLLLNLSQAKCSNSIWWVCLQRMMHSLHILAIIKGKKCRVRNWLALEIPMCHLYFCYEWLVKGVWFNKMKLNWMWNLVFFARMWVLQQKILLVLWLENTKW